MVVRSTDRRIKTGGFYEFKPMYVSKIPIVESEETAKIESLVSGILSNKVASPGADVSALERQIDQLVYQLYGLTKEEIGVVEGKTE